MRQIFSFFHLNLAFSSVPVISRSEIIEKCYWPLLKLIRDKNIPLGVEMPGWTLEEINRLDPKWVTEFSLLLRAKRCELIGSGYSQLIGPLVPFEVNCWNQECGLESYDRLLQTRPTVALVNEMAFSRDLVDLYLQYGYKALIIDYSNLPRSSAPVQEIHSAYNVLRGNTLKTIRVLGIQSAAFQKFQRCIHGEISEREYFKYLDAFLTKNGNAPFAMYSSDAEVFDFRPGRYSTEAAPTQRTEWERIGELFNQVSKRSKLEWALPSTVLDFQSNNTHEKVLDATSAQEPVVVKKQAKYNVTRWAISGRDDLWLNTTCHRFYRTINSLIANKKSPPLNYKRRLCELWSSDYRTHITNDRWNLLLENIEQFDRELQSAAPVATQPATQRLILAPSQDTRMEYNLGQFSVAYRDNGALLEIRTRHIVLELNLLRGMTINSLAFASHNFVPTVGSIKQGAFDEILLGVDWYCSSLLIEDHKERRRITDLKRVHPIIELQANGSLSIHVDFELLIGGRVEKFGKTYEILPDGAEICASFDLSQCQRPNGPTRITALTLLPELAKAAGLYYEAVNGGVSPTRYPMTSSLIDHFAPVNFLVSSHTGLGATTGELKIGSERGGIGIKWDPSQCAAFPGICHKPASLGSLTRLIFSLNELDDTSREGGRLLPFKMTIFPL